LFPLIIRVVQEAVEAHKEGLVVGEVVELCCSRGAAEAEGAEATQEMRAILETQETPETLAAMLHTIVFLLFQVVLIQLWLVVHLVVQ
jgi:hypothetical protein